MSGRRGRFITLEGGEGAGKSTQARRLVERLTGALGVDVVQTREPGGTPGAEAIRGLLVAGDVNRWTSKTEALLMIAARADHWCRVIEPALARGAWVVCDRFMDSTMAYQGLAGDVGEAAIDAIHHHVLPDARPDVTLVVDVPADVGLERARIRAGEQGEVISRFEAKGLAHHQAIAAAFHAIAAKDPARVRVVDGGQSADTVADLIWSHIEPLVHSHLRED